MAIINMPKRILVEIVESTIIIEEKLPMRRKNMVRYCHNDFDRDEYDDSNDEDEDYEKKTKKKFKKTYFNTVRRELYCQNYLNEGHFTKECKL
jgi:hypothetical protein